MNTQKQIKECGVLGCESFNNIECTRCKFISCVKCTQTFILSQTSAKCMNCNREYSEDYLREVFSKNWINSDYINWKKSKLLEREKGLLPETVGFLSLEKEKNAISKLIIQKKGEEIKLKCNLSEIQFKYKEAALNLKNYYSIKKLQEKEKRKSKKENKKKDKKDDKKEKEDKKEEDNKEKEDDEIDEICIAYENLLTACLNEYKTEELKYCQTVSQLELLNRSINKHFVERNENFTYVSSSIDEIIQRANQRVLENPYSKFKFGKICFYRIQHYLDIDEPHNKEDFKKERKAFIKPCPAKDCRGFLSNKWICGLCNTVVCKDCHEIKGVKSKSDINKEDEGEGEEDENEDDKKNNFNHKCDSNNIETAKTLNKETKGCPKCGVRIYKIDGCFSSETPILLWNHSIKKAKDIEIGDVLIGDDGSKRTVQRLMTNVDTMYKVIQSNGVSYTVNSHHTLVLIHIDPNTNYQQIVEYTVEKYLKTSEQVKKYLFGFKYNSGVYSNISVEKLDKDIYFGWEIDKNHRFILPDGTVVKNCDQMYCTSCHTAFSWRTGEIAKGAIHNPHYFQYLRQQGLNIPRANHPDANPEQQFELLCGQVATFQRILDYLGLRQYINYGGYNTRFRGNNYNNNIRTLTTNVVVAPEINNIFVNIIQEIERFRNHINDIINPRYRWQQNILKTEYNPQDYRDLRIKYLNKEIDEKHWNMVTMKRYKKLEYNKMLSNLNQTLIAVFGDFLNNCLQLRNMTIKDHHFFDAIFYFINYYNTETDKYTKLFGYNRNDYYIVTEPNYTNFYNTDKSDEENCNTFKNYITFSIHQRHKLLKVKNKPKIQTYSDSDDDN
jgi:ABC-type Zn2+ transport system substrate-binding protein/surface adhesin